MDGGAARADLVRTVLRHTGLPLASTQDMPSWMAAYVVFVAGMGAGLAAAGGDPASGPRHRTSPLLRTGGAVGTLRAAGTRRGGTAASHRAALPPHADLVRRGLLAAGAPRPRRANQRGAARVGQPPSLGAGARSAWRRTRGPAGSTRCRSCGGRQRNWRRNPKGHRTGPSCPACRIRQAAAHDAHGQRPLDGGRRAPLQASAGPCRRGRRQLAGLPPAGPCWRELPPGRVGTRSSGGAAAPSARALRRGRTGRPQGPAQAWGAPRCRGRTARRPGGR